MAWAVEAVEDYVDKLMGHHWCTSTSPREAQESGKNWGRRGSRPLLPRLDPLTLQRYARPGPEEIGADHVTQNDPAAHRPPER
jgi:hypothetical protein